MRRLLTLYECCLTMDALTVFRICVWECLNRKHCVTKQRVLLLEPSASTRYVSSNLPYFGSASNSMPQQGDGLIKHSVIANVVTQTK